MASSCEKQRMALIECLADSPCAQSGRPLKECMELASTDEGSCKAARYAYFSCKRGQLDMRKRIKGNMPAWSKEDLDDEQ